jgi:hypothetical protein
VEYPAAWQSLDPVVSAVCTTHISPHRWISQYGRFTMHAWKKLRHTDNLLYSIKAINANANYRGYPKAIITHSSLLIPSRCFL